ncbi:MAG: hypothetical protein JW818_10760 [Pirellulales bacterium]|nr:hypothetical protein [Pirellulales bacterium]
MTATASETPAMESLYQTRLRRYVTALRNGKPDRVPIRPLLAEFTAKYCGMTCQDVSLDYEKAFEAVRRCAVDFDVDALVANMVYVWTGLTQAIGLKYYGIPGIDIPADTGFQYREPPEREAFMRADEYDALIEDPTGYLLNVWLPRVAGPVVAPGEPATMDAYLSFLKGGMAMSRYFGAFGPAGDRLRTECGMPGALAGIFKAPMDILADKLRGYLGLVEDLFERRDKVVAACEALMPHLFWVGHHTADPARLLPIGFWMHRGCVPFVSFDVFENIYWATLKPIIEEFWAHGHQTLFYAEGNWDHHLEAFAQLPERSIVYHVDQGDPIKAHEAFGDKFCISGGLSNVLLAHGQPEQVRARVAELIATVAQDGGYVLDASAIIQNDAKEENIRAMIEAGRELGVYSDGCLDPLSASSDGPPPLPSSPDPRVEPPEGALYRPPGTMIPWAEKRQQIGPIPGDEAVCRRVWEDVDALAYMYVYQVLLSF